MVDDPTTWAFTLIAVGSISVVSVIGALGLILRPDTVHKSILVLVSFAAGALLGDAFLHLIPEVAESSAGLDLTASLWLLAGVVGFFVLEKLLHWHHAHLPHEEVLHPVAVTNLVGDGLHNFVDGAIVAGSFMVSSKLGLATAIAVALHEIPQEIGDFSILVHAGLKPRRALALNLATALTAVVGGAGTLLFAGAINVERIFIPFTAGAFVYIASTDLLPELHKEPELRKSTTQLLAMITGIGIMLALLFIE